MKKPKKNAPRAMEQKPEESKSEPVTPEETEVKVEEPQQPKPLTPREEIEVLKAQMLEVGKNFEAIGAFIERMNPLLVLSERIQQQQQAQAANPQPQQPAIPGNMGGLQAVLPFLQMLGLGGGGNADSELAELGKKSLRSQIGMAEAITNAVVSKIVGKATTEVADTVTGT